MTTERLRPRLSPLLTRHHLDAMHASALQVLDEAGLHVSDDNCLRKLESISGVTRRGARLHFAPEFVDEHVQAMLRSTPEVIVDDDASPTLTTGGHATHFVHWDTDELLPLTAEAAEQITRIIDALHDRGVVGGCPGAPQDVVPGLREVRQALIGWENSRHGGAAPATSLESADFIYAMNEVMGRGLGVGIHIVSPLRLEGVEYEIAARYAPRGASLSVGSMPIMGVSAPIHPVGAFVLAIAEVLGSWLAVKLVFERERVGFSIDCYSVDMSSGAFIYGNPEQKLIDLIKRDVNAYYHVCKPGRSMYSMAKRPGAQSCAEMAMLATTDALAGQRQFLGTQLAVDEVCSPEQYVLCLDIMGAAARIADGVEFGEETLCAAGISDVIAGEGSESFLTAESTLRHHRDVYWQPRCWDRAPRSMSRWGDIEPARLRAKQDVRDALAAHDFRLDDGRLQGLREVYASAERHFGP